MRTPVKLGGYALALAAVFTAALGLGHATGSPPAAKPTAADSHNQHSTPTAEGSTTGAASPAGLQITQDGYRLSPITADLTVGDHAQPFQFRLTGPDGAPVTHYTTSHDKDLHLIVVRRDLSGFQHLHPSMAADGTWSVPLAVAAAGQYRVFADFQPAGRDQSLTLGVDMPAPGDYRPVPLPSAARTANVDGYRVGLHGDLLAGGSSQLTLSISKDGTPVTDLQPYLGAYGHLVALRDGDLAYLHVHPDGTPGDGRTRPGPEIVFHADVPTAGSYRLYLDFQHGGRVHTAEFTATAGPAASVPTPPSPTQPSPSPSSGHGEHTHG
ncbi:hypothetical protein ACIA5D_32775 [Actinoplanes sp. NPDC051513]|uniref:hypothetical protein n=1 Tax=Actinoplanes sp. NPDC051513 TaxID=3363908 RepID=UPI00378CEB4F